MIRTLQESICLQNDLISIFNAMIVNFDTPFYMFMDKFSEKKEYRETTANAILDTTIANIIKECIVLQNQIWKNNPSAFNEGLIKNKVLYNIIKDKIQINNTIPFNKKESFKRIREAIAHNSEEIQNCQFDISGSFNLNLGKPTNDIDGQDIKITLTMPEMVQLILLLNSNKSKDEYLQLSYEDIAINSVEDAKKSIFIINNNSKYNIDKNQSLRVYNALHYCLNKKKISEAETEITEVVSNLSNESQLLEEKIITLNFLTSLYNGGTWNSMKQNCPNMNKTIYVISVYYSLITNLLFNIVTSRNNNEIFKLFEGSDVELTLEDVRHIRNSLCHGRYFHDFNDTIYFYDGNKKLSFATSLTIHDLNKILDKIAKGKFLINAMDEQGKINKLK